MKLRAVNAAVGGPAGAPPGVSEQLCIQRCQSPPPFDRDLNSITEAAHARPLPSSSLFPTEALPGIHGGRGRGI